MTYIFSDFCAQYYYRKKKPDPASGFWDVYIVKAPTFRLHYPRHVTWGAQVT